MGREMRGKLLQFFNAMINLSSLSIINYSSITALFKNVPYKFYFWQLPKKACYNVIAMLNVNLHFCNNLFSKISFLKSLKH